VTGQKATNPRRVGGLERDEPGFLRRRPWSGALLAACVQKGEPHEGRAGGKPDHRREKENPGGEKTQESYALDFSLNRWIEWRTLAWSKTL
jgi:hypothetical protein